MAQYQSQKVFISPSSSSGITLQSPEDYDNYRWAGGNLRGEQISQFRNFSNFIQLVCDLH